MNISTKKIVAGIVAVLAIIDAGLLISASDKSVPGDILYQVDLAVDQIEVYLAPINDQADYKFKMVDERISEVEQLLKDRRAEVGRDTVVFSERESRDINQALAMVGVFLEKNKTGLERTEIEKHLARLLALIELDRTVRIERHGETFEMEE